MVKNRRAIDGYANGSYCYAASKSTKLKLPNSMKSAQELFAIIGFLSLVIALVSVLALDIIRGDFANRLQSKANADSMAGSGSDNSSTANLATGPATISLSIASSTDSSGGSNISISSPSGGGIATGYHTLKVITNSDNGYDLSMKSSTADTSLKPSGSSNTNAIPSTTATLSSPSTLSTRTWGIALPDNSTYASFSELADYTSADASALSSTKYAAVPTTGTNIMSKSSATDDDTQNVVFGVNAKDPTQDEPEAKEIALAIELFTNGSLNTFAMNTNVDTSNSLICYDILDLGKQLLPIGMLVVLDSILNRITSNRVKGKSTYIFIDEIYLLFQYEYSANFLFTLWKRVRKYGAFATGITQNVEDLLQSHTARTMLANSEFIIMLNQASTDRLELAKLLNISDPQMSYITNVGAGEGLIKVGSNIVPFINKFPRNTELYKLMSTKPGEEYEE